MAINNYNGIMCYYANYRSIGDLLQVQENSTKQNFRKKIGEIFNVNFKNVEIFSFSTKKSHPSVIDVRFFVHSESSYFKAVHVNGMVLLHQHEIEDFLGINITMVRLEYYYKKLFIRKKKYFILN